MTAVTAVLCCWGGVCGADSYTTTFPLIIQGGVVAFWTGRRQVAAAGLQWGIFPSVGQPCTPVCVSPRLHPPRPHLPISVPLQPSCSPGCTWVAPGLYPGAPMQSCAGARSSSRRAWGLLFPACLEFFSWGRTHFPHLPGTPLVPHRWVLVLAQPQHPGPSPFTSGVPPGPPASTRHPTSAGNGFGVQVGA